MNEKISTINSTGLSELWTQFKSINSDILVGNPQELVTEDKTIIGAINEILAMIDNYKD